MKDCNIGHLGLQEHYTKKLGFSNICIDFWGKYGRSNLTKDSEFSTTCSLLQKHYDPYIFKFLNQVHQVDSIFIESPTQATDLFSWGSYDACYTTNPKIALAIRVADCIPILFWSKKGDIIGVIHAGWRGLKDKIVTETINKLIQANLVSIQDLLFWIGPHIGKESYEVGNDVYDNFSLDLSYKISNEKRNLDLQSILSLEFKRIGIQPYNIIWSYQDTFMSSLFYSHRRGDIARNIGVIYLQ